MDTPAHGADTQTQESEGYGPGPTALVGRVRELAALSGRLEAAAAGHGSIALVTGAPGIGKSRLATELGVLADKRRQQLFDAIVPFVLSAARVRPVLLILDDVQSADRASLALLRYLARSVGNSGILILATFRDEEVVAGHPLAELVPTLRREAPLVHVALRELNLEEASALIAQTLDLHDRLYTGPLVPQLSLAHTFVPHMTIGRIADRANFAAALEEAAVLAIDTHVLARTLTIYTIEPGGSRYIEAEVALRG